MRRQISTANGPGMDEDLPRLASPSRISIAIRTKRSARLGMVGVISGTADNSMFVGTCERGYRGPSENILPGCGVNVIHITERLIDRPYSGDEVGL